MRLPATVAGLTGGGKGKGPVLLDGGLATQCEAMGHDISGSLWSAGLLRRNPDAIRQCHLAYLEAGAQIIISASYQVSRSGFRREGLSEAEADETLTASTRVARAARDDFAKANPQRSPALVAASVGPYGATLHDGSEYTGDYSVDSQELHDFHRQRLDLLDGSGADLLACETIPSLNEARVLRELLQTTHTPAWVSFCCRDEGHISDGSRIEAVVELFIHHPGVFAVGVNCTNPAYVQTLVTRIRLAAPGLAIVVYPNSGESWLAKSNRWDGAADPDPFPSMALAWHEAGADIIGGCCRIGPSEIARLKERMTAAI